MIAQLKAAEGNFAGKDIKSSLINFWLMNCHEWSEENRGETKKILNKDYAILENSTKDKVSFDLNMKNHRESYAPLKIIETQNDLGAFGLCRLFLSGQSIVDRLKTTNPKDNSRSMMGCLFSLNNIESINKLSSSLAEAGIEPSYFQMNKLAKLVSLGDESVLPLVLKKGETGDFSMSHGTESYNTNISSACTFAQIKHLSKETALENPDLVAINMENQDTSNESIVKTLQLLNKEPTPIHEKLLGALVRRVGADHPVMQELANIPNIKSIREKVQRQDLLRLSLEQDPVNFMHQTTRENVQEALEVWQKEGQTKYEPEKSWQLLPIASDSEKARQVGEESLTTMLQHSPQLALSEIQNISDPTLRDHMEAEAVKQLSIEDPAEALRMLRAQTDRPPSEGALRHLLQNLDIPIDASFQKNYGALSDPGVRSRLLQQLQMSDP